MAANNISEDVIWFLTRNNASTLVKRKSYGGVQFSRDPLNLTNKHSKKYEGYANDKAIGINPSSSGGLVLTTKRPNKAHQPRQELATTTFGPGKSTRSTYRAILNGTARKGYRSDLRAETVARASAIRQSQRKKTRESKGTKLRGKKARQAKADA